MPPYCFAVADGLLQPGDTFFVIEDDRVLGHTAGEFYQDLDGSYHLVVSPRRHFHLSCYRSHDRAVEVLVGRLRQEMRDMDARLEEVRVRLVELERENNHG